MTKKRRSLLACTSGIASVEFALLGTLLLVLFAGGFDLVYLVSARRDADRTSMLIARTLTTCADTSCAITIMNQYMASKANTLPRYQTATIGMAVIQRTSGAIKICAGNMTYLETDVQASALNIMKDNDVGAAVYIVTNYKSILPNFVTSWLASAGNSYRNYTVDVRGNGSACV